VRKDSTITFGGSEFGVRALFTKRGCKIATAVVAGTTTLTLAHATLAGGIVTTTSVYALDASEPGLPNYTPSVGVPAIETINPNSVPADASFSYTYPTPGTAAAAAGNPGIVQGSVSGLYAAPYDQDGQQINSPYFSAGGGAITVSFSNEKTYFGLLWGSVDTYNSLVFNNVSATGVVTQVAALTGSSVLTNADGAQTVGGAVWLNMDFLNGNEFNQVVFSDSPAEASFEFAAISTNSVNVPLVSASQGGSYTQAGVNVPEPGSIALFGAGLIGLAVSARRHLRAGMNIIALAMLRLSKST
jgi:hypothetical protein